MSRVMVTERMPIIIAGRRRLAIWSALAMAVASGSLHGHPYAPEYIPEAHPGATVSLTARQEIAPSLRTADFDDDGVEDVVACHPSLINSGVGRGGCVLVFGPIPVGAALREADFTGANGVRFCGGCGGDVSRLGGDFDVGDVNGDGLADLVASSDFSAESGANLYALFGRAGYPSGTVVAERADGSSGLADGFGFRIVPPADAEEYDYGVELLDLDADGFDDVLTAGRSRIVILHGGAGLTGVIDVDAAAAAQKTVLQNFSGHRFVRFDSGDVTGDGVDDLVIADSTRRHLQIVFGRAGFPAEVDLATLAPPNGLSIALPEPVMVQFAAAPAMADYDGDGVGDIAVSIYDAEAEEHRVVVLRGGAGLVPDRDFYELAAEGFLLTDVNEQVHLRALPDVDGDGRDDLALTGNERVSIWLGTQAAGELPRCALRDDRGFALRAKLTAAAIGSVGAGSPSFLDGRPALLVPTVAITGFRAVDLASLPIVFADGFGAPCE